MKFTKLRAGNGAWPVCDHFTVCGCLPDYPPPRSNILVIDRCPYCGRHIRTAPAARPTGAITGIVSRTAPELGSRTPVTFYLSRGRPRIGAGRHHHPDLVRTECGERVDHG